MASREIESFLKGKDAEFMRNVLEVVRQSDPALEKYIYNSIITNKPISKEALTNIEILAQNNPYLRDSGMNVKKEFERILKTVPEPAKILQLFQSESGEEGSLTIPETEQRISSFEELGKVEKQPGSVGDIDANKLRQSLILAMQDLPVARYRDTETGKLYDNPGGGRYDLGSKEEQIERAVGVILNLRRLPISSEEWARELGHNNVEAIGQIAGTLVSPSTRQFFDQSLLRGDFSTIVPGGSLESGQDLQRLKEVLSGKKYKSASEEQINEFVSNLPDELARGTEQFISGERARGSRTLREELFPEILQQLNARGLLYGGDLPSELARTTEGVLGGIEQTEAQLLAEDAEFFRNSAYQQQLRKTLESGGDVEGEINFARQQNKQRQEIAFQQSESALNRSFAENLYRRRQERNLSAQQDKLRRQNEMQSKRSQADTISSIVTPIAQVGTSVAVSKGLGAKGAPSGGGLVT